MEKFLKNQQIPLTQVIDPNTGQAYYAPQNVVYQDKNNTGVTSLKGVIVDSTITASYALTSTNPVVVTSPGGIYYINGIAKPVLTFVPGQNYRFDTSNVDFSHPFKFSLSPNGPTQYTYGVSSGSGFIEINVDYNTSQSLYYYLKMLLLNFPK
jgi:hypothetical protein